MKPPANLETVCSGIVYYPKEGKVGISTSGRLCFDILGGIRSDSMNCKLQEADCQKQLLATQLAEFDKAGKMQGPHASISATSKRGRC